MSSSRRVARVSGFGLFVILASSFALGFQPRQRPSRFDAVAIPDPTVAAGAATMPLQDLTPSAPLRLAWESFGAAHGGGWRIVLDRRSGAPLLVQGPGIPWLAGSGNSLDSLERSLRGFVAANRALLIAGDAELVLDRRASGQVTPETWIVEFERKIGGVPVQGDRYRFTIGHGKLISFGATRWGAIGAGTVPSLSAGDAYRDLAAYMGIGAADVVRTVETGRLVLLPLPADQSPSAGVAGALVANAPYTGPVGAGIRSALAWRMALRIEGDSGTWVGLVEADGPTAGRILALFDDDHYAQVKGGVYTVSDDQICPSGCEQAGYPMPFADLSVGGSPQTANTMGLFDCSPGGATATTTLAGPYARINDSCGAVSESVSCDNDLDLRTSAGADCTVPSGSSPGNTHAARTDFYVVNRLAEHGRAWLPSNTWLTQQLTTNVNISATCNAYWNGVSLNMYLSGGGCNNTGEIAGVVQHEWGHGLDNNDGGGYDNPTEAYADITALMANHASCIGRGFYQSQQCGGYGNACLNCTGIRDQDWNQRQDHTPSTPAGFVQSHCGGGSGPCGAEQHCEAYVSAEAMWDLAARDLPALGLDSATAWQITDRLWYLSRSGSGGNAYNCSLPNSDGCGTNSWFSKLRVIDDDDGNLANGTPHASAIFAAFDRHKIACGAASDPSNQNTSSCPALAAPVLSATAGSSSASLSWTAVANASSYNVLRNDIGCDGAYTIIATVAAPATTYTDSGLATGFPENYRVQAVGANSACTGTLSSCQTATPQPFAGSISLDRGTYGCSATITITVRDANIGAPSTAATIWSTREPGPTTVTLTETPSGSARYVGSIPTTSAPPSPSDAALSLGDGDLITAQYIDSDDGQGGQNLVRQTTAAADCQAPSILNVASGGVSDTQATISWSTDQTADGVVTWGPSKPPLNVSSSTVPATSHAITLTGLQSCTVYYYKVSSTDTAGNTGTDDNGGQYFHFETLGNFPGSGLQPCHQGRVSLDAAAYSCSSTVGLRLIDIDVNRDPSVADTTVVQLTSTTETLPETAVLTETGPNTSVFTGSIPTASGAPVQDGKLQLADGNLITATYHDADDGTGQPAITFATAVGDCAGPAFSSVSVTDQPPFRATVSWTTAESSSSRLDYGSTTALGKTVVDPALVTSHALTVTDLNTCSLQYFKVSGTDLYGNAAVDDRGGALYTFESGRVPGAAFIDGFETSSGWSLSGEWEIAAAQGKGGSSGYHDPPSAYSGGKVLGTDLSGTGSWPGDYEPNVSIDATSPTIDCRTLHNATLIIRRWLNVATGDTAQIFGYNHGWASIWKSLGGPFGGNFEAAWSVQRYDVSAFADGYNRFQLRFDLTADASIQESGWNIDDVVLKDGSLPDQEACGSCASKPSFAGLSSATDVNACADTGIALSWPAAASWGSATSGTYAVYRDTTPNFTPTAANRLVAGLTTTTYTDATAPNATTLYYLVRAENSEACSNGPHNGGVTDDNTSYRSSRDDTSQSVPSDLGSTVRVAAINGVHVRLTWSAGAGAASYDVLRADNPQMTGAVVVGHTTQTLFDDTGELVNLTSRYYVVRGVNACGTEGP